MRKSVLRLFSLLLLIFITVNCFTVYGVNGNDCNKTSNSSHVCFFNKKYAVEEYKFSDATCFKKAEYYFSCECEKKGYTKFEYGEKTNHIYLDNKCIHCGGIKVIENIQWVVYITPTGKRYHYLPTCAGKNATPTTQSKAIKLGFTGCKKCTR